MPRPAQKSQTKWISRIAASRWTRLFIFTAFLQALIVFVLESEILKQTLEELGQIQSKLNTNSSTTSTPVLGINATDSNEYTVVNDRFRRMKWENVWFMAFQVWLFWIAFDGINNQNTVEIIALAVINVLCAVYACVQVSESIKWRDIVDGLGIQVDKLVSAEKLALGMMICIIIFACGLFYLSWQLFRQFGWNVYKKIGADLQLRKMYRTFQMYVLILKVDLYFEFATSVFYVSELIIELSYVDQRQYAPIVFRAIIALSILPALYGARRVVAIESRFWAIVVIVFHLIVFINFALVLHETILPDYNWYFWIFILVCGIVISLATSLGAFLTLLNFNKGLKPFVQVSNTSETTTKGPVARFDLESDSYSPSTLKDVWGEDEVRMEKISVNRGGREDREALIRRSEDSDRLHSIDIGKIET